MNWKKLATQFLISLIAGLVLGAAVAAVTSTPATFWNGWAASSFLIFLSVFFLLAAWKWAGQGRLLAWMVAVAFLLRLACGVGLGLAVQVFGYADSKPQQAGFIFYDAYKRDIESWDLAQSGEPMWQTLENEFDTDQYGGLLVVNAAIYRFFSMDAHRTYLLLILTAFSMAVGLPFFWKGVAKRWGEPIANISGWILALYPDSIMLGSSQMREPFLMGLGMIAFWAVLSWKESRRTSLWVLAACMLGMSLFSTRILVITFGALALWFWVEYLSGKGSKQVQRAGWVALALAAAALVFLSWSWLSSAAQWDALLTQRSSGWVSKVIEEAGAMWAIPFVTVYGVAQPVLPAAIADASLPLWQTIAILRAAGWYALVPLLLYAFIVVWKVQPLAERRTLLCMAAFIIFWTLLSSARAGGDQWDNPRYRVIFLPWMALLAGWAVQWSRQHHDAWLGRWIAVEGIFLAFFTQWYLSRYYKMSDRLPFWVMVGLIVALSAAVFVGGAIWDRRKALK